MGMPASWSRLPLLVHDAIALIPPSRTAQLSHERMTLKLGSRRPVLIDSIEVPAASANVSDEHVDAVEDDPAPATVRDDAIPHVCDSHDDGVSQGGLRLPPHGWSRAGHRDACCCGSLFKFCSWYAGHLALNIFEMRCFLAAGVTDLLEMQMKARAG